MLKEIKYLIHLLVIFIFFFFSLKYYFSDNYKKKFYRNLNLQNEFINDLSKKLPVLKNNTKNIIEYVENNTNKAKKKYQFWKLLEND